MLRTQQLIKLNTGAKEIQQVSLIRHCRYCLWPCSLAVPVLAGWVYGFMVLCPGTPKGSTGSCSGFKASQKTGLQLKVSSDRLGEAGNRTYDHWFTRHRFIPYTTADSPTLKMCTDDADPEQSLVLLPS